MRPSNNIPQFVSPNRFDALRMTLDDNDKESDRKLIQNETDSNPLKPTISKTASLNSSYSWRLDYTKRLWQCCHEINKT